jgi:glycosyltransferase involved in cell wall biosynthesis
VVDDGSTDGTAEMLQEYAGRIALIRKTNAGAASARNTGIRASSGEYLALLDSDDMWLPHKLERQVTILENEPEVGLVYSLACKMDGEGRPIDDGASFGRVLSDNEPALPQLLMLNAIPALTAVFRRACIAEIGFFDEALLNTDDYDMWLRIATRWRVACVPEPLAIYREHATNISKLYRRNKTLRDERWRILEKSKGYLPEGDSTQSAWNKAIASAHLLDGETEAYEGDANAAGIHLARAFALDPDLYAAHGELVEWWASWVILICQDAKTGVRYRKATNTLFSSVPQTTELSRIRRRVLATAAMKTVFECARGEDFDTVRSVLPVGVQAAPEWLVNRGVWSTMADAFLGQNVAAGLRNVIGKFVR